MTGKHVQIHQPGLTCDGAGESACSQKSAQRTRVAQILGVVQRKKPVQACMQEASCQWEAQLHPHTCGPLPMSGFTLCIYAVRA